MKIFVISTLALTLTTGSVSAQSVGTILENTNLSFTGLSGPFDFTLEGNRNGATEVEIGMSAFEHSYNGVDAELRFAFGSNLRGADTMYGLVEYNFGSEVVSDFEVYGTAAVRYDTNTNLSSGLWTFEPSVGATYDLTSDVSVFAEVGYSWELNQAQSDLGGYVEVGVPFAVNDSFLVTPSVSRTFRTGNDQTTAHLNFTYQF